MEHTFYTLSSKYKNHVLFVIDDILYCSEGGNATDVLENRKEVNNFMINIY